MKEIHVHFFKFLFLINFSTNFKHFLPKTISIEALIAQKLKNTLILGGYDVIRGEKGGYGRFLKFSVLIKFFQKFCQVSAKNNE